MQAMEPYMEPIQSLYMRATITNITSYDVLADPSMEGVVGEYQLENYKKNVGNNRLKVFLALYQQDYDRARRRDNAKDCDSIVVDILHTLNTKCVPTGRFLINTKLNMSSSQSQLQPPVWNLMGEHESKHLIHGILKGVPPPDSYRYKQRQQQQMQQQQMQQQQQQGVGQSNSNNRNIKNDTEELKRRRRSSLLRRSASDSLLDDSKKVSRYDQQQQNRRMSREEPTWSSSHRLNKNGIVSLNRMDVILTSSMDALDPNCQSIGNNRLHILVAMQSGKYQQANDRQKEAILDEVMQTVKSFWKGRFLTESSGGCYELLDNRDAKRSLRHIFDMRSGQNLFSGAQASTSPALNIMPINISSRLHSNSQLMGSGSHELGSMNNMNNNGNNNQLMRDPVTSMNMRHVSTSALPSGNTGMISNDTKSILSRQMSSSLVTNPKRSSLLRIEPPMALSGINDLRSAAIKSLQKQKARQQVANRLEKVSMRNSQVQQQHQLQQQLQQPNNINNMNGVNTNNNNFSSFSMGGGAKRRQSSIFGALDPSVMDEIVDGCFDDEDD